MPILQLGDDESAPGNRPELKARIFEAFEHACRYGEAEVADTLLAIIDDTWVKPAGLPDPGIAGAIGARTARTSR